MFNTNLGRVPIQSMEYRLPSAGIPYLAAHPDFPDVIRIKPYNIETEAHLVSNATYHDKMRFVVEKVAILPPGFSVDELIVDDQLFILAVARALTYGETYSFQTNCPHCSHNEVNSMQVPEGLPVKVWNREFPPVMEVTLPICKDRVVFRPLTIRMDGEANRRTRELAALSSSIDQDALGYRIRLAQQIGTVGGNPAADSGEAEQWVAMLSGEDMVHFRDGIVNYRCGIQFDWLICCDKCSQKYQHYIPLQLDFFRRNRVGRSLTERGHNKSPSESPKNDLPTVRAGERVPATPTSTITPA